MLLLTPELLAKIKAIIEQHHTAFVVNMFGQDTVLSALLTELKKKGLIDTNGKETVANAYLYGQITALLENPDVAKWSQQKVLEYVKKNPVPLTPVEQAAVTTAKITAASYVVGLGNTVDKETGQLLIEADHALRAKLQEDIADETAKKIAARKTVKQLKSDLGHRTQDWTRNLDRIAITETHNAMQAGVADGIKKKAGKEARVAIRPMPDACPHCRRLHLGTDGQPRIFKISQLEAPGYNVKKKPQDWKPCIGAVHPHCQCQLVRVPAGWGFDESGSLVPGGEFGVEHDEMEKSFQQVLLEEEDHRDLLEKASRLTGRLEFKGLVIAIEQEQGDFREWRNRNGASGSTLMHYPYGFIENTVGEDDEPIDVYVGPDPHSERVYVINQRKRLGEGVFGGFDEQKVMLGFSNPTQAKQAYLMHYDDPGFFGSMLEMPFGEFRDRVRNKQQKVILKGLLAKGQQERFVIPTFPEDPYTRDLGPNDLLEKAGPHKYTTKVWSVDHWVYTYANTHGGKVSAHHTDKDAFAIKLPKDKAEALEAFRVAHGLPGKVLVGKEHAVLPMTIEQARTAWKTHVQTAKPVVLPAVTIPETPAPEPTPPPQVEPQPPLPELKAKEDKAIDETVALVEEANTMDESEEKTSKQKQWAFGGHIFGSKKDKIDAAALVKEGKLGDLSNEAAALVINKASLMPALNAEKMQALGASPGGAHLALQIAALVAPKPGDSKKEREDYTRGVQLIAGTIEKIKTVEDAEAFRMSLKALARGSSAVDSFSSEEAAEEAKKKLLEKDPTEEYLIQTHWVSGMKKIVLFQKDTASQDALIALGTRFLTQLGLGTMKTMYGTTRFRPYAQMYDVPGKIYAEARSLAKEAEAKGEQGWEHIGAKLETKKAKAKARRKDPTPRFLWRPSVTATPDLTGTKVFVEKGDRDRLGKTFNIREQKGEALPDKELNHHLRHAEMALHDLADVLGISPEDVSLNGRLGIAFAARGSGGALAHYETKSKVINITRFAGAGSLAHEWGHFLDNIIAEANGAAKEGELSAHATTHMSNLPPELRTAVQKVMDALSKHPVPGTAKKKHEEAKAKVKEKLAAAKAVVDAKQKAWKALPTGTPERDAAAKEYQGSIDDHNVVVAEHNAVVNTPWDTSEYKRAALSLDGGKPGKYYSAPTEMWARGFESYIQDKLEDNGRRNSYLVDGTRITYDLDAGEPYPQQIERERINLAFDDLMGVLRSGGYLKKSLDHALSFWKATFPEGAETMEQEFTATTGAGALMLEGPPRPVNEQEPSGLRYILTEPGNEQDANKVRKDKEDYLLRDNAGRMSWVYPLEIDPVQMRGETDTNAEENKEDAERLIVQITDTPRFMPQEHMRPVEHVSKSRTRSGIQAHTLLEKAGPHKYTSKTWQHGHWVYAYAEERGGKVVPHATDAKQVMVKIPKQQDGKKALEAIKKDLPQAVFEGDKYAMLALHEDDVAKLGPGPVAKKAAPKAPKKPTSPATPADVADMPPRDKTSLQPSPKAGWFLSQGTTVSLPDGTSGTVQGWDYAGRMVVKSGNTRRVLPFQKLTVTDKAAHVPSFQKLAHPNAVRAATEEQKAIVDKVLSMKVGGVSGQAMADWLHQRGHETYLVGGIVRDLITGTDPKDKKTTAAVVDSMNDVDLVSSAPPDTLRKAFTATGAKPPVTPMDFQKKGCVSNGELDLASLATEGVYDKDVFHPDVGTNSSPATFDHDLEKDASRRDFTANALYYDVHNKAVIDPTGTGVEDARNKVLRLPPGDEWKKNDKISLRFWKLRARGWTADDDTKKAMVAMVDKELAAKSSGSRSRYIAKQIGKNANSAKEALEGLKTVMATDGASDAYAKHIAPIEGLILSEIKAKKG